MDESQIKELKDCEFAMIKADLTKNRFMEIWNGSDYYPIRKQLDSRSESWAMHLAWMSYRKGLNGSREN